MNVTSSIQKSNAVPAAATCHCSDISLLASTAGGRGLPQPPSCFSSVNGTSYRVHSSVSSMPTPKSLKHSVHTLPSGSVLPSGILNRTYGLDPFSARATKATPLYLEALYGLRGYRRSMPRPAKVSPEGASLPLTWAA
jgi:hypothetical protein